MSKRKIALVSDSRCSHSLYRSVLDAIKRHPMLDCHYIVTGMHLLEEFGETVKEIEKEGYVVGSRIPISYGSSFGSEAVAVGQWIGAFAEEFSRIKPDIILVQGDRGVSLAAAIAGAYMNIPVAHMFGGEVSGTIDESARHAITKLAHLHFPETKESAERLEKMGEEKWRICLAGSTGVEFILSRKLLSKEEIFKKLGLEGKKTLVVLQHPVSFEAGQSQSQMGETLKAIGQIGMQAVVIYPNDDAGSGGVINAIKAFEEKPKKFNAKVFKSLPFLDYLSLLKVSSALVGNSSGAIIETPSLGIPAVNIGTRQQGREKAPNIISVGCNAAEIRQAIEMALNDRAFLAAVRKCKSPYNPFGTADAGKRIANALADVKIDGRLLEKKLSYGGVFMERVFLGSREIGKGKPVFFIAEAGSNFNGSMETAKKLIEKAAWAGADAIKFQTFKAEKVITANAKKPAYQTSNGNRETYQESLKKFEISKEGHKELQDYCKRKGVIFLSTPHGQEESVELLESIGVPAYKIGSGDLTNLPFLKFVAKKGKPVLLSTGMSNVSEISEAVSAVKEAGNSSLVLLQCTSSYPCKIEDANLLAIKPLEMEFSCLAGFSDHTTSISLPAVAAALGAVVIEKHFTLDRSDEGPDHQASLEPEELRQAISFVREAEKALGSAEKVQTKEELELAKIARKSIVAAEGINQGEVVSVSKLEIKRPGTGIQPKEIGKVLGKKAKRKIEKDSLLSFNDLE